MLKVSHSFGTSSPFMTHIPDFPHESGILSSNMTVFSVLTVFLKENLAKKPRCFVIFDKKLKNYKDKYF